MSETEFGISNVIVSTYAHWVIFGCSVFALGWGGANAILVSVMSEAWAAWIRCHLLFWRV